MAYAENPAEYGNEYDELEEPLHEEDIEEEEEPLDEADEEEDSDSEQATEGEDDIDEEVPIPDPVDTGEYSDLPEELRPRSFKTKREEFEWLKENYSKALDYHKTDAFKEILSTQYEEEFSKIEAQKVEALIKSGKIHDLKAYYPDVVAALGGNVNMSPQERGKWLEDRMINEFGSDYREVYSSDSANTEGTLSWKMYNKQEELKEEFKKVTENIEKNRPPDNTQIREMVIQEYNNEFKKMGMDQKEFEKFYREAQVYAQKNLKLIDLYRAMNYEKLIEKERANAIKTGKKNVYKEIAGIREKPVMQKKTVNGTKKRYDKFNDEFLIAGAFRNPFK